MRPDLFTESSPGTLVQTPFGMHAFVPHPLPPKLDLAALVQPLTKAMHSVGELNGASRRLPNPYILIRPLQRREALTSSAMEGTFTTDDELLLVEKGLDDAADQASKEVRNYLRALTEALRMLHEDQLPICHKMIKTAHSILLSGVGSHRGAHRAPGEYKRDQNAIGGAKRGIENARFIPPPPQEAEKAMDDLEAYINRRDTTDVPALIDLALTHYQFETIHPFSDGNGRVGRMLVSLMAVERGLFQDPLLYISPELENKKDQYIDLMFDVSSKGEWTQWVEFFLEVVADSSQASIGVIDRLLALQDTYRESVGQISRTANALTLVDMLFVNPVVTVRDVQDAFNITYRAARLTIDKLIEAKILMEISRVHPTAFIAPEIMRVADRA